MKHYIDTASKEIYAFEEDGSQDHIIPKTLKPITDAEADSIRQANIVQPVPSCTAYQFHEALNLMGLTDVVNSASANDPSIQNALRFAQSFRRDHPKIATMAAAIGKTEADIDALFALAITLSP